MPIQSSKTCTLKQTHCQWFNLLPINQLPNGKESAIYVYLILFPTHAALHLTHVSTTVCQPNPPPRKTSLYTSTPRCGFPWGKKTGLSVASCSKVSLCVAGDAVGRPTATHKQSLRNMRESQLLLAKSLTQIHH